MIDYRELLKKYMLAVDKEHGHDCLYESDKDYYRLSDDEFKELQKLSKEAGSA